MSQDQDLRETYRTVAQDNLAYMQTHPQHVTAEIAHEMYGCARIAATLESAVSIRMRAEQAELFLNAPIHEGQDYRTYLRLPFPSLLLTFSRPVVQQAAAPPTVPLIDGTPTDYWERYYEIEHQRHVLGISLVQLPDDSRQTGVWEIGGVPWTLPRAWDGCAWPEIERIFTTTFLYRTRAPAQAVDYYMVLWGIGADNRLHWRTGANYEEAHRRTAMAYSLHLINFLNSPTVKLVREGPSPQLQKARQRRGKPPLPGWYEIAFRKEIADYTRGKISTKGLTHRFRYDVIGHFKSFRQGRLAGRVIWTPAHQRGLAHTLYKPKGYVLDQQGESR